MSSVQMKVLIALLILAIIGVGIGLYFTVVNNDKEYAQLQEEFARKKEQQEQQKKAENENKKDDETKIIGLTNTKIYNTLTKKIIEKNLYIEVEVNNVKTIKAVKDDMIYSSTNNISTIIKDEKMYTLNSDKKEVIVDIPVNNNFSISFIDTNIEKYSKTEIENGTEKYNDKEYYYEKVGDIKYYFTSDKLEYAVNGNNVTKIISISEPKDSLFDIPEDYKITDKTLPVNDNIDVEE